ncbi:uncharacterized protein LOC111659119 [Seriola lalandi dorsalis]|uniref:Uncharacterized LOC111659119 n=1 Tax=Seriola lalandi dorsalis TaxID=1841481 RepID=A0A3B4WRP4_SERLL|nr:uncharacterized protein LOC111659119 [Seriola lalandi dorsalis]
MEASPYAHATSLLMSLNLQRERAQFCDCVVRQRQSPGQLYPAHKCVLAASSPVLASILSSTGALVELQAPCLSGSVLALILEYIYTGTLPYTRSHQHYYSLLSAACHLQMDELQETLKAWQRTEVNDADKTNASTGTVNQPYASSLDRGDHQYSANVETCDEAQIHSASRDSCIKCGETDTRGASSINGANRHSRRDVSTLSDVSMCCSTSEPCTESRGNTGNWRQVTILTPQELIQNIPCTAEVHGVSKVDKEVQRDQFHSAGTVIPEKTWQKRTEGDLVRTNEDRKNSCSSSPSSPHPCCGAVPVIRHSSRAAMLQLAGVSAVPPYHPVSQLSVNSSRAPVSQSASIHNDSIDQGITTKHKNHYEVQNQDYENKKTHTGTQCWDYQNSSDQCAMQALCYKSSADQSDMLEQDYNSSNVGCFMKQNDEQLDNTLSHITDLNDHHAHCDLFQNKNHTKHLRDDSVTQNKVCSDFMRGFKHKTELSFDDLPSKHQSLYWSDCHDVSMSAGADELSQYPRTMQDSDTRSDSNCEDCCPTGNTKEEHSYSSRSPAEINRQDLHCKVNGPKTDWYPKDNRGTVMEDERQSSDVCLPFSTTPESNLDNVTGGFFAFERRTSLDHEKISDTEITEPHLTFTMPVDSNMSDSIYSLAGQSYHGHLHYHCLPQEDTHFMHEDSDHKCSHTSHPDHSDQSSDEEEAMSLSSPGHSPLRQHYATAMTDQVLLLDISAKPAEMHVSHGSEEEERSDTFGNGVRNNDKEQGNEGGVDKRNIRARKKFGAESFDEGDTQSWVAATNFGEGKFVGKDQCRPGADAIRKAGTVEEVSNPKEGENQSCTLTVCSPLSVPDTVQASKSSTLSVCIAPTLSASMPTNISAHLSTPLHQPFQCSLCDRSFSQRGSLNRHVRSHLGVRPFPCPCCPMTFSRQYRVTEHMRVHQRGTLRNDFHKPPTSSI